MEGGGEKISPTECVQKYEDTGHETIIRELTQNALDAAREAGRECTMHFEIRKLKTSDLPGIAEYRQHLCDEYMQEWLSKGQSKYKEVLDRLNSLALQEEIECLFVFDNGVGLDYRSMEGLIGKGDSNKREDDGGSGGTHGVGHETAFAAGDMNYVMYGGVNRGRKVASGHVVFPTHFCTDRGIRWGGHGYLSQAVDQISLSGVAIIDKEHQIPPLIGRLLGKTAGSGSVVVIPSFNRFPGDSNEEGSNVVDLICEDIAKHFFIAVDQDRLNVFVRDCSVNGNGNALEDRLDDADDVERALNRVKHIKQRRGNRLLAGFRSHESWLTYKRGDEHVLKTSFGKIKIRVRYHDQQRSRIAILRAGMFITDDESKLPQELARRHFVNCKPFHAVLLFADNLNNSTEADNILRLAEDPGHSGIRFDPRSVNGRMARKLFSEIKTALLKVLESRPKGKSYTPDFMPVKVHSQRGTTPPRIMARPKQDRTNREGEGEVIETGSRRGSGSGGGGGRGKRRSVRRQLMLPASRPIPTDTGLIELDIGPSTKKVNNAILYLETLTGSDATCESPLRGQEITFDLSHCLRDGKAFQNGRSNEREIHLGRLDKGLSTRLTLQLASDQFVNAPLRAVLYEGDG